MLSSAVDRIPAFDSTIGGSMSDQTAGQNTNGHNRGDSTLFAAQLSDCLPSIRNYISCHVRNRHDAEDLVQDTLIKSLRVSETTSVENPLAYSLSVARSVVIDYWRRNQRVQTTVLDEIAEGETATLDDIHIQGQKAELLLQVISELPPLRREVFLMRRVHGLSRDDIAVALDMNTEAVKKHISRAMVSIARAMEKAGY